MYFPTTPVLDDLARADGALGANYTSPAIQTHSAPQILSQVMVGDAGAENSTYWNPSTFGPSSESFATVPSGASGQVRANCMVNMSGMNTANFYGYVLDARVDNNTMDVNRYYNSLSGTSLLPLSVTIDAGHKVGLRSLIAGADIRLEMWLNTGNANGWQMQGSVLDVGAVATFPVLTAAGNIGWWLYGDGLSITRSLDDLGGGTANPAIVLPFDRSRFPKAKLRVAA